MPQDAPAVEEELEGLEPAPIDAAGEKATAQAALYMRAIRALDREAARIEADYRELRRPLDEDLRALDEWRDDRLHGLRRRREQLEDLLKQFGRAYKTRFGQAPKRLAFGKVTLTPPRDSLEVVDEEAFVDWAEGTDRIGLVSYKKTADKEAIKAALKPAGEAEVPEPDPSRRYRALATPDGEPVPGVVLSTPREDSASVKVDP
jgi:hypothetical protein